MKVQIAMEALILMDPKIKKSLLNTSYQDRADLEQEIKLKLLEAVINNRIESPPSIWEFKSFVEKRGGCQGNFQQN